eukprot:XP_001693079.1 predicted protein [Chlamydomonas reinhardtii]
MGLVDSTPSLKSAAKMCLPALSHRFAFSGLVARYLAGPPPRRVSDQRPSPTGRHQGGSLMQLRLILLAHQHYMDASSPERNSLSPPCSTPHWHLQTSNRLILRFSPT